MSDTVYISDDVHVSINEPDSVDVSVQDGTEVEASIDTVNLIYGGLPTGGNTGDILVKTSPRNYYAEWMSLRQAGLTHIYYDTTANWNAQASMISEEGAIYIYSDYYHDDQGHPIPGIKIGDGSAYLIDIPINSQDLTDKLYDHINNSSIHVSEYDRTFWNNKVTSIMDPVEPETLILTKEFIL